MKATINLLLIILTFFSLWGCNSHITVEPETIQVVELTHGNDLDAPTTPDELED